LLKGVFIPLIKGDVRGFKDMRRSFLYDPKLKLLARQMRAQMTAAEKKLWYGHLRQHQYRFLRQKPIGNYIADFYCPALQLIIEVDGETHLNKNDNPTFYDKIRTKKLEEMEIKIVRFWNNEILEGFDSVIEKLEEIIKNLEKL
jgi:very-short-patch-repair endonuclease